MTCPNCGKSNKENEPFCGYCGAALVRAKTQKNVQKTLQKNALYGIIIV